MRRRPKYDLPLWYCKDCILLAWPYLKPFPGILSICQQTECPDKVKQLIADKHAALGKIDDYWAYVTLTSVARV